MQAQATSLILSLSVSEQKDRSKHTAAAITCLSLTPPAHTFLSHTPLSLPAHMHAHSCTNRHSSSTQLSSLPSITLCFSYHKTQQLLALLLSVYTQALARSPSAQALASLILPPITNFLRASKSLPGLPPLPIAISLCLSKQQPFSPFAPPQRK